MIGIKKRNSTNIEDVLKKEQYFNEVHYLPKNIWALVLVFFFVFLDSLFIYQIITGYFVEAPKISLASTIGLAILIDVSPSILAGCISVKNKKRIHYAGMIATSVLLLASFLFLAMVRIHSGDMIYSVSSTTIQSALQTTVKETVENKGQQWVTALYCIMPVFTSVLSFMIGVFENSESRELFQRKISGNHLYNEITKKMVNEMEIEAELKRDLMGMNEKKKALVLSDLETDALILKEKIKLQCACAVGTPQALDNMMKKKE